MKIIIIGTAFPLRGGIAHYNALLYEILRDRGHNLHMISFKRQYPSLFFPGKTQQESGKEYIKVDSEQILDSIGPLSWIRVANRVRQHNPDLIIFKYWMPFFAPCFATISFLSKLWCDTKVLFVCDNIAPHESSPLDNLLTRTALGYVDLHIVMSDTVKHDLLRFRPNAEFRQVMHPIYNIFGEGISKQTARKELGIQDERVILFFGYIRKYKGLHVLLDAMPKVLRQVPVKLLVAGEFYDPKESYLQQIERLGLSDHVTIMDEYIPNDRVKLYYSVADFVALPYTSATQSGIVQICYNFNKPVIATNVGGLPEIVKEGKTGYIVPANDAKAFADSIIRFYQEDRGDEFAAQVAAAKKDFSWDRLAEAIESFFE